MKLLYIIILIVIILYSNTSFENFKIINESIKTIKLPELVIVTSHYNEDLKWLEDIDKSVICCSKKLESVNCPISKNVGNECTSYLKFIIDNYYNLPEYIAFIHGHKFAWHHTSDLLDLIYNNAKYNEYDYISLNNYFIDDRTMDNITMKKIHEVWDEYFRPYLKRDPPTRLLYDCCAQFIVSRRRILALPKEAYEKWYNLFIDSNIDNLCYIFEYTWHIIFGEPDIVTYNEHLERFIHPNKINTINYKIVNYIALQFGKFHRYIS